MIARMAALALAFSAALPSLALAQDTTPPASASISALTPLQPTGISVRFNAVGDDGMTGGPAAGYSLGIGTTSPHATPTTTTAPTLAQVLAWLAVPTTVHVPSLFPAPVNPNTTQTYVLSGLTADTRYYIVVAAFDEAYNLSFSNVLISTTVDNIAPSAITNLAATASPIADNTVTLTFSRPRDNGEAPPLLLAGEIQVRYRAGTTFTQAQWDDFSTVPVTAGVPLLTTAGNDFTMQVATLAPETTYTFAVKTKDDANNFSLISNAVTVTTIDLTAPGAVSTLEATVIHDSSATLRWTAPGDSAHIAGTQASSYSLRYSSSPILQSTWNSATPVGAALPIPSQAGQADEVTVHGLLPGTHYYFALTASDEGPREGLISNLLEFTTGRDSEGDSPCSSSSSAGPAMVLLAAAAGFLLAARR